ncbi:MAG: formate dehydrogenase subunit alpha [Planctomycetota bacterium]
MAEINLTIDGLPLTVPEGTTVLEAARFAEIYIPTLCWDADLEPVGACRMCIVEIDGMRGLPTACTTQTAEGMVVRTDTDRVNQVRRTICEMLIADHPADCLSCSSNQRCQLQEVASFLGVSEQRMPRIEREALVDESNPFFTRDLSKCILCGRCVRACLELRGVGAIEVVGRGFESRVGTFGDVPISESVCESCGECIARCPVDALSVKSEVLPPTREVKTTCPYCGCGCGLVLGVRGGRIVRIAGDEGHPVSRGSLCVKGRFGLDYVSSPERLTTPLIRRDGELKEATWEEAIDLVAGKLAEIKAKDGPDALAGLSSAKCTNEENYLFQKFMRAVLGTNNVDHCARLCHASTVAGLARAFGSGAMTNSIAELEHADCILVIGSNTTEAHPIIALFIKAAVRRHGAQLIVADPRRIDLVRFASLHLRQRSGTDVALFNAMMNVILAEGLHDEQFIAERTEGFEEFHNCIKEYTPERAEAISGVPADDIRAAARTYAGAERASIVYSMGITQHTTGTDNVLALANLAMLTGNMGLESTGVNPLRGQNYVQGACDLGALPNVYPGYQKVDDPEARAKFERAWGVPLPQEPGLTVLEIIDAAAEGRVKGLYVMGENPMLSDPDINHVREALQNLEFLCVQDIFLSETAQLADVVLPAASFAEKEGTFTNTERRVQRVRKAIDPPGEATADWQIICRLAAAMGQPMSYEGASEVLDELTRLTPIYGGMSFERTEGEGLQWPCPDAEHPGTVFLHQGQFKRGLGKFHPTPFREADELPDEQYPYLLTTGRLLYHFHTGTLTRRSEGLEELSPPTPFEINPLDAAEHQIKEGDVVRVSSRRGEVQVRAHVTDRAPKGTVFMPFHFREAPANVLTNPALDPIAKIPELKVCAVKVEKLEPMHAPE